MQTGSKEISARNYGIDLLRILAMFMVAVLHVGGLGGAIASTTGIGKPIATFIQYLVYCAVDCYAIISGFVSYSDVKKPYKYRKYVSLWLSVAFYSFGITLIYFLIKPGAVSVTELIKSLFPVSCNTYWYFGAYTALFFVIPWLNDFVRERTVKEMNITVTVIFILFSVFSCLIRTVSDPFMLMSGCSFIWLALLYIIGAWLKKCKIPERFSGTRVFLILIAVSLLQWLFSVISPIAPYIFIWNTSPTTVIIAACFVMLFSKFRFCNFINGLIKFFSPAAFGVYLIHVHPIVWKDYIVEKFTWIAEYPSLAVPFIILACGLIILIAGLFIDKIRILIFRLLHIDKLIDILSAPFNKLLSLIFGIAVKAVRLIENKK